jgi:hypothetical protein
MGDEPPPVPQPTDHHLSRSTQLLGSILAALMLVVAILTLVWLGLHLLAGIVYMWRHLG